MACVPGKQHRAIREVKPEPPAGTDAQPPGWRLAQRSRPSCWWAGRGPRACVAMRSAAHAPGGHGHPPWACVFSAASSLSLKLETSHMPVSSRRIAALWDRMMTGTLADTGLRGRSQTQEQTLWLSAPHPQPIQSIPLGGRIAPSSATRVPGRGPLGTGLVMLPVWVTWCAWLQNSAGGRLRHQPPPCVNSLINRLASPAEGVLEGPAGHLGLSSQQPMTAGCWPPRFITQGPGLGGGTSGGVGPLPTRRGLGRTPQRPARSRRCCGAPVSPRPSLVSGLRGPRGRRREH